MNDSTITAAGLDRVARTIIAAQQAPDDYRDGVLDTVGLLTGLTRDELQDAVGEGLRVDWDPDDIGVTARVTRDALIRTLMAL